MGKMQSRGIVLCVLLIFFLQPYGVRKQNNKYAECSTKYQSESFWKLFQITV